MVSLVFLHYSPIAPICVTWADAISVTVELKSGKRRLLFPCKNTRHPMTSQAGRCLGC